MKTVRLLIGGSPCTYWSICQKNNRETEANGIGWELFKNYLIAKEKFKPDYFLYENNESAAPAIRQQIAEELGVWDGTLFMADNGIRMNYINSALLSAQNRKRFYVTNCGDIEQPADRRIYLKDVLESGIVPNEKSYVLKHQAGNARDYFKKHHTQIAFEPVIFDYPRGKNKGGFKTYKCPTVTSASSFPFYRVVEPVVINPTVSKKGRCCTAGLANKGANHVLESIYSDNPNKQQWDCIAEPIRLGDIGSNAQAHRVYSPDGKPVTINSGGGGQGGKTGLYFCPTDGRNHNVYEVKDGKITIKDKPYPINCTDGYYIIRKLTVLECMRLQTVRENYIFPVSETQAYKMLGNGWTVEVIKYLLSHIPELNDPDTELEVLSMYDGMSCGNLALECFPCRIKRYVSYEIDKYAIQTTQANFPFVEQRGDAFQLRTPEWAY